MRSTWSLLPLMLLVAIIPCGSALAACSAEHKNKFVAAILLPGPKSGLLAAKLARTSDYGRHGSGWLASRLFALDDDVEISGNIVSGEECFQQGADDDLVFFIELSPESREMLRKYFSPSEKAPAYIHVEMIARMPTVNCSAVFKSWREPCGPSRVQFAIGNAQFQPIRAEGDKRQAIDWVAIKSWGGKRVSVKGALVIDTADFQAGAGQVEIHPAEYIRLLQ